MAFSMLPLRRTTDPSQCKEEFVPNINAAHVPASARLPPLRQYMLESTVGGSSVMERKVSTSSVSSYCPGEDCPSYRSSPTTTLSDQKSTGDRSPSPLSAHSTHHHHPYATSRQKHATESAGIKAKITKASRGKVPDRYKASIFNRTRPNAPTPFIQGPQHLQARLHDLATRFGGKRIMDMYMKREKIEKKASDAARRFEQGVGFSCIYEQIILVNPSLKKTARASALTAFHEGLTPLKSTNMSDDILEYAGVEPFPCNKIDLLELILHFIDDSNTIIREAVEERATVEAAILPLLQSDPSREAMAALLLHILRTTMSHRIMNASAERGSTGFQGPLGRGATMSVS